MDSSHQKKTKKKKKAGVVYLSRIPHLMSPAEARQYFDNFGFKVGRMFFKPESKALANERRAHGGNMLKKKYLEGWIEFEKKSHAKKVALAFNTQQVGGTGSCRNEMWCIRYLSGFKWDDLKEEEVYKRALHDRKVRKEVETAKEETQKYLDKVDKAKKIEYAIEKKREQGEEVREAPDRKIKQRKLKHAEEEAGKLKKELLEKIVANTKNV